MVGERLLGKMPEGEHVAYDQLQRADYRSDYADVTTTTHE
jgi:hypothetical protein